MHPSHHPIALISNGAILHISLNITSAWVRGRQCRLNFGTKWCAVRSLYWCPCRVLFCLTYSFCFYIRVVMHACSAIQCVYLALSSNFSISFSTRAVERGGEYPGLLPRGPGQKGARTQTVTSLQVLQDMK